MSVTKIWLVWSWGNDGPTVITAHLDELMARQRAMNQGYECHVTGILPGDEFTGEKQ